MAACAGTAEPGPRPSPDLALNPRVVASGREAGALGQDRGSGKTPVLLPTPTLGDIVLDCSPEAPDAPPVPALGAPGSGPMGSPQRPPLWQPLRGQDALLLELLQRGSCRLNFTGPLRRHLVQPLALRVRLWSDDGTVAPPWEALWLLSATHWSQAFDPTAVALARAATAVRIEVVSAPNEPGAGALLAEDARRREQDGTKAAPYSLGTIRLKRPSAPMPPR